MRRIIILKRSLASLLAILVCIVTVNLAEASEIESISFLFPAPYAEATRDLVQQFNRENHGKIKLSVIRGPFATEAMSDLAISSLILGKAPFDGLLMDVTWLPKYAATGWVEPLESYFDQDDVNSLAVGAREGNSYENHLYRWPLVADMGLLYWRTDLMKEPPKTPEELISISKSLQKNNMVDWGYVWQGRQYEGLSCVYLEMIEGFGGYWFKTNDNKIGLDQAAGVEAASWLQSLIKEGVSPQAVTNFAEQEALQSFRAGDSAFMRNWPYAWAELQQADSSVRGKVGVTTMVANPGYSTATNGSWGLTVLSGSSHIDAAVKAIRFLTNDESQKQLFLKYGYTPTKQSIFDDPFLLKEAPIISELGRALKVTKPRPETPLYAQISDVLQRQLSGILTVEQTPDNGMVHATRNTEQILISAGEQR